MEHSKAVVNSYHYSNVLITLTHEPTGQVIQQYAVSMTTRDLCTNMVTLPSWAISIVTSLQLLVSCISCIDRPLLP